MALTERLALLVTADVEGAVREITKVGKTAERELGKTEASIDKVGKRMTVVGAAMMASGVLAAGGLLKMGKAASDLNETVNQTDVVFGDAASKVGNFAKEATKIGQSERAAREAANTFGLFFTNIGIADSKAADMSITMTALASDMASFKNTTPEQAVEALGAALRGESEPIRQYGVMLDDATLKQRAMQMGLVETTTGVLPPSIRMQAAYAEILAQTSTIQGDFARTADGTANAQRIMSAEWENMQATIGSKVLPVMAQVLQTGNGMLAWFNNMSPAAQSVVGSIALVGTTLLIAGGAMVFTVGQLIRMRGSIADVRTSLANLPSAVQNTTAVVVAAAAVWATWQAAMARARAEGETLAQQSMAGLEQAMASGNVTAQGFATTIDEVAASARDAGDAAASSTAPWDEDFRTTMKSAQDEFDATSESMQQLFHQSIRLADSADVNQDAVLAWLTQQQALGVTFEDDAAAMEAYNTSALTIAGVSEANAAAIAGVNQEAVNQKIAFQEAEKALKDWEDAVRASVDPLFKAMDASEGLQDAQNAVADAQERLNEAHRTNDFAAATEAERDLERATWDLFKANVELEVASKDLATAVENGTVSVDDAKAAIDNWTLSGRITADQAGALKGKIDEVAFSSAVVAGQSPFENVGNSALNQYGKLDGLISRLNTAFFLGQLTQAQVGPFVDPAKIPKGGIVGGFAGGGVVPGALGEPQMALVHGGEVIVDPRDTRKGVAGLMRTFGSFEGGGTVGRWSGPTQHMGKSESSRRKRGRGVRVRGNDIIIPGEAVARALRNMERGRQ